MSQPLLLLGAQASGAASAKRFFDKSHGSIAELLKSPSVTRQHGWDMRTLDDPRIVEGNYMEVGRSDYKLIRVYRDGTVVFRGVADEDLLGWGRREGGAFEARPRINSAVLTELVYHFVRFVGELTLRFDTVPGGYELSCGLRRAELPSGRRLYVTPFEVGVAGWDLEIFEHDEHEAPQSDFDCKLSTDTAMLQSDPARVAADLLAEFYVRFGMPTDELPYIDSDLHSVRRVRVPIDGSG